MTRRCTLLMTLFALASGHAYALLTAPYFPLNDGASWSYQKNGSVSISVSVLPGAVLFNGNAVKAIQISDGRTLYFTSDANGIRQHGEVDSNVYVQGYGYTNATVTFSPPVQMANADATLGAAVTSSGTSTFSYSGIGTFPLTYSSSCTPVTIETVAVPAGIFPAVKVQCTLTISGMINGQSYTTTDNDTTWLANGIGQIRDLDSTDGGAPQLTELVSSSLVDTTPDEFGYSARFDVAPNSAVYSLPSTVTGINTPIPISIAGGQYSINSGTFKSTPDLVMAGDQVVVLVESSPTPGAKAAATVTVGSINATFEVTTAFTPGTPVLFYVSQPGDYIGLGQTALLNAGQGSFTASRNYNGGVSLSINSGNVSWSVDFAAPSGSSFGPGSYERAVRYPFNNGLSPGLSQYGDGRGCNTLTGRFDVIEASFGSNGEVLSFAANYAQHCEGGAPALFGQIRYGSNVPIDYTTLLPTPFSFNSVDNVPRGVPVTSNTITIAGLSLAPISIAGGEYSINGGPFTSAPGTIAWGQTLALRVMSSSISGTASYATVKVGAASETFQVTTSIGAGTNVLYLRSQAGDYIGGGIDRLMYAGTQYAITPSRNYDNGVSFNIQGVGDYWTLDFAAAGQAVLAPGAYENATRFPFQAAGQPGLDLSGAGRGCNQLTGRFDVLEAAYGTDGAVTKFAANFEQHCEGGTAALVGRIRYNSFLPLFAAKKRDFDVDGRSDVLLQHASGANYLWFMNALTVANSGVLPSLDPSQWQIAGTGDFDGDGKADILLHHSSGLNYIWFMNGSNVLGTSGFLPTLDANWSVAGIGDFDGDGKADILLHHSSGLNYIWFMNGLMIANQGYLPSLNANWSVAGIGDFDGDGKADILLHHSSGLNYIWILNGNAVQAASGFLPTLDATWSVGGVGDFDGDGKSDVLLRHTSGYSYVWFVNGTTVQGNSGFLPGLDPAQWQVSAVGDYDGDGKSDILLRHTAGYIYMWLMNGLTINNQGFLPSLDPSWSIVNK